MSVTDNGPPVLTGTRATQVQSGPQVESKISDSQITAGRDMNSSAYHVNGNLIINKFEGITLADVKGVLESGGHHVGNEDTIAIGMPIPSLPPCVLERESLHEKILTQLLSVPNARVAILGMGGIGKTTLACSIADDSQVLDSYPRRLFLSFEGCSTPDLAYTNLANAFQIPADRRSSHPRILSQVLNYLKQEKTLFVIDNFETFWEVSSNRRCAEDFLGRISALKNLAMIVTLRGNQRPGNIRWLKLEPLQTLTYEASKELISIITDEGIAEGDLEYIQKLLNAVAGIPLAVTLVGILLRDASETPRSLWNQWTRDSARAIRVANEADSDDRLYKLEISLRLSVFGPRMTDHTKEAIAAISILPTGINMDEKWLDKLQSMLPTTIRIRDAIRTLRDVALATVDSSTCPLRLKLLPPVREFCLNNLPLNGELTHRLIDLYIIDVLAHNSWESNADYVWVTVELSNISAIINHAIALHYVSSDFGRVVYEYTEWRRLLCIPETDTIERAIDILSDHRSAKAICLQAFGSTLSDFGREQEAIQQLEQALSIHRENEEELNAGWDLYLLGGAHHRLRNCADAERYLTEARDLFTEADRPRERGVSLDSLAEIYLTKGEFDRADCTIKEALDLCRASGDRFGEANALRTLGRVYGRQGKYNDGIEKLKAAIDTSKAINYTGLEAIATETLGDLYRDTDERDQAVLHYQLAIPLYERSQMPKMAEHTRSTLRQLEAQSQR